MLMMVVPDSLSNKVVAHSEEPSNMYEIICSKVDKNGNNKLAKLCKDIGKCIMKNIKI